MSFITDKIDEVKALSGYLDTALQYAARSVWTRLSTMILIGVAILTIQWVYLDNLHEEIKKSDEDHALERTLIVDENRYKTIKEWIDLCITSKTKSSDLSKWHCDHATALYKKSFSHNLLPLEAKIIEKKSYGAMSIDMNHKIRSVKLKRHNNSAPTEKKELLDTLVSKKTTISFSITIAIMLLLLMYFFSRYTNHTE